MSRCKKLPLGSNTIRWYSMREKPKETCYYGVLAIYDIAGYIGVGVFQLDKGFNIRAKKDHNLLCWAYFPYPSERILTNAINDKKELDMERSLK